MSNKAREITMEGAILLPGAFRNFSGRETMYNRAGARNFNVVIPNDQVEQMLADDWNVKFLEPRDEGELPTYYLPVAVGYNGSRPPRIVMLTSSGRRTLNESTIEVLDWANITTVDLTIRQSHWSSAGKSGYKAYLQALYANIEEDYLDRKYATYDPDPNDQ